MTQDFDNGMTDAILSQAAMWHLRCEGTGGDAVDWDALTLWLEADPRHRAALDQMALTATTIDDHTATLAPNIAVPETADVGSAPTRRRTFLRWGGMAIAASLAAVIAVPQFMPPADQTYVTSDAGRRIAMSDGSAIFLAPRSQLTVSGRGQDHLTINGGAMFDIRHDPARTLTVSAGDVTISDIGTRFDVQQQGQAVRVAVADGQVRVAGDVLAQAVTLTAGAGLTFDAGAGVAVVAPVRPDNVGGWQNGRLTYDNAALPLVVDDLHRYAGIRIEVPASLRSRRFTGTLIVGDGEKAARDLVGIMGLRLGGRAGAWKLEPR